MTCKRCAAYARRLDELNRNFNLLWDWIIAQGYDPDQVLDEARDQRRKHGTHHDSTKA